jgi:hypothetical protein
VRRGALLDSGNSGDAGCSGRSCENETDRRPLNDSGDVVDVDVVEVPADVDVDDVGVDDVVIDVVA